MVGDHDADLVVALMSISACLVTRGDVDMEPILKSLPSEWEWVVWNNGAHRVEVKGPGWKSWQFSAVPEMGAYGRYNAIDYATSPLIYTQDDDCIVQSRDLDRLVEEHEEGILSALMPASRTDYNDTVLIGWGSMFDRDLPEKAFYRWRENGGEVDTEDFLVVGADFIFPMLTPWKRIDAEHTDLAHAFADNRTWKRRGYNETKSRYLHKLRKIRDAA